MVKKFTVFFVAVFLCSCLFAYAQQAGNKDFSRKEADNSNFEGTNLTGADFTRAELENCNFKNANLTNVNFSYADLGTANLRGANIKGANFTHADLEKATWIDGKVCAENSIGNCN